jgi:hypothetical protein
MLRTIAALSCLASLAFVLVVPAAEPPTDGDKNPKSNDKAEPRPKLVPVGEVVGKIAAVDSAQRSLKVSVTINYIKPGSIVRGRGYESHRNPSPQSQSSQIDVFADDDVKVRLAQPPLAYDAKGNPKKYTAQELRALRGPGNQWGYPGDFDSLKNDQVVRVVLMRPKDAAKPSPKDKKTPKDAPSEPRIIATTIYVLQDSGK